MSSFLLLMSEFPHPFEPDKIIFIYVANGQAIHAPLSGGFQDMPSFQLRTGTLNSSGVPRTLKAWFQAKP